MITAQTIECESGAIRLVQFNSTIIKNPELIRMWVSENEHPCTDLLLRLTAKQLRQLSETCLRLASKSEEYVK